MGGTGECLGTRGGGGVVLYRRNTAWGKGNGKFENGKRGCKQEGLLTNKGRNTRQSVRRKETTRGWLNGVWGRGGT